MPWRRLSHRISGPLKEGQPLEMGPMPRLQGHHPNPGSVEEPFTRTLLIPFKTVRNIKAVGEAGPGAEEVRRRAVREDSGLCRMAPRHTGHVHGMIIVSVSDQNDPGCRDVIRGHEPIDCGSIRFDRLETSLEERRITEEGSGQNLLTVEVHDPAPRAQIGHLDCSAASTQVGRPLNPRAKPRSTRQYECHTNQHEEPAHANEAGDHATSPNDCLEGAGGRPPSSESEEPA